MAVVVAPRRQHTSQIREGVASTDVLSHTSHEDVVWECSGRLPSPPPAVPPKHGGTVDGANSVVHDGDDEDGDGGDGQYDNARGKKKVGEIGKGKGSMRRRGGC